MINGFGNQNFWGNFHTPFGISPHFMEEHLPCCSLECTIINSEAIHLMNCWMGLFIYRLHDNWLYHNFADISPPKYIRWKANFKLLSDWFRCFYGVFRLLLRNIFQKQYKMYDKAKQMIISIIKQITVTVYKNIIKNEILS